MKNWKHKWPILACVLLIGGCQALTKDYQRLGENTDDDKTDSNQPATIDSGTSDTSGSATDTESLTVGSESSDIPTTDSDTSDTVESSTGTEDSDSQNSDTTGQLTAQWGDNVGVNGGGGEVKSASYKLKISLGGSAPKGHTKSNSYKINLGTSPAN